MSTLTFPAETNSLDFYGEKSSIAQIHTDLKVLDPEMKGIPLKNMQVFQTGSLQVNPTIDGQLRTKH